MTAPAVTPGAAATTGGAGKPSPARRARRRRERTLGYALLRVLAFASGNLERRGGNTLSLGSYEAAKAGRREFASSYADTEFGRLRKGALPGTLLSHSILDAANPVRALFVVAGNPLLSIAGEARALSALGSQGVSYKVLGFYPSDPGPAPGRP